MAKVKTTEEELRETFGEAVVDDFTSTVQAPKVFLPLPLFNDDGTPRFYTLKVKDVEVVHGVSKETQEPIKSFKWKFNVLDKGFEDRLVSLFTGTEPKRYSANYKKNPSGATPYLSLVLACGLGEPKVGTTLNAKDLIGKIVLAELKHTERGGQTFSNVNRVFLKK